ncbi:MAG: sensor domain-containing diguanylate cyclase [Chloroflexi bacterium]|nr:sensor domain-containing diguanylate cyclase [Chloroflexota bacterium]
MRTSLQYAHRVKRQVTVTTITFITVMHVSYCFLRGISIIDTTSICLIAVTGAVILINFSFHKVEQLQEKLARQLSESQRQYQRQSALARLSGGFAATHDEDEICKGLAQRLQEVQGYEQVSVYLLNKSTEERVLHADTGHFIAPATLSIPPGIGLSEQPILDGQLHYTPDISEELRYLPGLGQGSEVDVPIQYDTEVMGVLVVESHQVDAFNQDDFDLLTAAADQAAIALENIRLLTAEQARRREAEILRETTAVVSSALDLGSVLDRILIQLEQVVHYDSACIFLLEEDKLLAKAARELPHSNEVVGHYFSADDELFQLILRADRPVILGDVRDDPRFEGWGGTHEMCSWMGVPLKVGDNIIGCLTLDNSRTNAYDDSKANLARIFANRAAIALENAQLYYAAKNSAEKLLVLHEVSQDIISAGMDIERIYTAIHEAAKRLMPCEAFAISILDDASQEIEVAYMVDRDGRVPPLRMPSGQGLSGHIISTGKAMIAYDFPESDEAKSIKVVHIGSPEHIRAFIAVPLRLGDKIFGMLSAQSYQSHEYTIDDQHLLEMLAAHATIALDNAQLFAEIQRIAIIDSLTEVYNRRYFFDATRREFSRSYRYQNPLSIIMLDLDHYKRVNDIYGHATGDQVLKLLAQRIQGYTRESDTLGRYGGDEFCILLPETDIVQALEIAERLRTYVASEPIQTEQAILTITLSLGVSSMAKNITDLSQLLQCADTALYDAKQAGRNCVRAREWPLQVKV